MCYFKKLYDIRAPVHAASTVFSKISKTEPYLWAMAQIYRVSQEFVALN